MKRIDKMKKVAAEAKALAGQLPRVDLDGGINFSFKGNPELLLLICTSYGTLHLSIEHAKELHKFLKKAFEEDVN